MEKHCLQLGVWVWVSIGHSFRLRWCFLNGILQHRKLGHLKPYGLGSSQRSTDISLLPMPPFYKRRRMRSASVSKAFTWRRRSHKTPIHGARMPKKPKLSGGSGGRESQARRGHPQVPTFRVRVFHGEGGLPTSGEVEMTFPRDMPSFTSKIGRWGLWFFCIWQAVWCQAQTQMFFHFRPKNSPVETLIFAAGGLSGPRREATVLHRRLRWCFFFHFVSVKKKLEYLLGVDHITS